MKKVLSIALAIVLSVSVLCLSVSAVDLEKKELLIKVWAQDTANWNWVSAGNTTAVKLGETTEVTFTDGSMWAALDTSASINMGLQVLDQTLTANGEHSEVKYELSDLVIKATGYDDLVVKVAGTYEVTHDTVRPDWTTDDSVIGGASEDYTINPADIGITNTADYTAWFNAIESMTVTVKYISYNGEGAAEAPAENTEAPAENTEAPAENTEAPAETTAPTETSEPANTGIVLAVLPMAVAAAAVVASKRK